MILHGILIQTHTRIHHDNNFSFYWIFTKFKSGFYKYLTKMSRFSNICWL
nr:MAG TPA: hypothetical protein [Caudoviricetes sp.]